jgi:hypothetical protein
MLFMILTVNWFAGKPLHKGPGKEEEKDLRQHFAGLIFSPGLYP